LPFTPLHFGPAVFAKGVSPKHFSLTAFVAANVAIDLEPLYHLVRGDYPIHGPLHTFVGATTAGLLAGASIPALIGLVRRNPLLDAQLAKLPLAIRSEFSLFAAILGGSVGGASHPLLDSLVHSDVFPFAPWSSSNPFLGAVDPDALFNSLVAAGGLGLILFLLRAIQFKRAG
jgi:Domain of unknown function (DUF4184)